MWEPALRAILQSSPEVEALKRPDGRRYASHPVGHVARKAGSHARLFVREIQRLVVHGKRCFVNRFRE
jgi:hypothetical protein